MRSSLPFAPPPCSRAPFQRRAAARLRSSSATPRKATAGAGVAEAAAEGAAGGMAEAAAGEGWTAGSSAAATSARRGCGVLAGLAKLVYVLSEENDLYSFDPPNKTFTKIGTLGCNAPGQTPNSMAVSRDATAWSRKATSRATAAAGSIFQVSTTDASCMSTEREAPAGVDAGRNGLLDRHVRGDERDAALRRRHRQRRSPPPDQHPWLRRGVPRRRRRCQRTRQSQSDLRGARADRPPSSGALTGQNAELTGTGDGRLFGFFTTTPIRVAQLDKTSGATSNVVPSSTVEEPVDWAFSF